MTRHQSQLVSKSWLTVSKQSLQFAERFYSRLFELAPDLRRLFKIDMEEQGRKLATMLDVVIQRLDTPEEIVVEIRDLGRRHRGYGVAGKDYESVATALLWALQQQLGTEFTPQVKAAWIAAYTFIAGEMQTGAA